MTTTATTQQPPTNAPLTKSQKKRLKRAAAKSRKEASAQSAPPPEHSINPQDILRNNLVSMGYAPGDINTALDEMWELGLKYDEVDAVLNYLQERKERQSAVVVAAAQQQPVEVVESAPRSVVSTRDEPEVQPVESAEENRKEEESEKTVSTVDSSTPMKQRRPKQPQQQQQSVVAAAPVAAVAKKTTPTANSNTTAGKQRSNGRRTPPPPLTQPAAPQPTPPPPPPQNSIGSKLDMVANAENLMDAISALTQWVTKAASVTELREFCSGTITRALFLVIRRSLTEKTNIMGQLLDLLCSILRRIGIPHRDLTTSAKALQSAIVHSRATLSSTSNNNTSSSSSLEYPAIADAISQNIVSTIANTVHTVTSASHDGARTISTLETEIEGIVAEVVIPKYGRANARDLMSNRDCHKVAAEKYSKILQITMQSKNAASNTTTNGIHTNGHSSSNNSNESIMESILGDQYKSITTSKQTQTTLQKRLAKATSTTVTGRQRIVSNLTTYVAERDTISTRMEELKLELHQLETAHSGLTQKIDERRADLTKFDRSSGATTGDEKDMEALLAETNQKVQLCDAVTSLAQHLEELGVTLNRSSIGFTRAMAKKTPVGEEALVKFLRNMELYLVRMKNYFDSEVRMVGFLRERAISLEQQLPSLEFEIQECTALGMTSNVSEMTKNLKDMVQNVADDRGIADALSQEAESMQNDLMERSEQYLDMVRRGESKALDGTGYASVLNMIRQNASQIELPETNRYRALIDSVSGIAPPPGIASPPSNSAAISSPPPGIAAPASIASSIASPPLLAAPVPIPTPIAAPPPSPVKAATTTTTLPATNGDTLLFPDTDINNTSYQNGDEMQIPGNVIIGAGQLGTAGVVGDGSTVRENIAAIEKLDKKAPAPDTPTAVKLGWGKVQDVKATSKSLVDIQKEELSMK